MGIYTLYGRIILHMLITHFVKYRIDIAFEIVFFCVIPPGRSKLVCLDMQSTNIYWYKISSMYNLKIQLR